MPKIIPSLRRILNCHLEPVEFWDAIRVVFAEAGKDWGKTLHLEMMALDSPSTVMPLLGAVANALQDFGKRYGGGVMDVNRGMQKTRCGRSTN